MDKAHTILDIQAHVNLMQHNAQIMRFRIRHHDELEIRRGFVVVELVVAGAVGDETVVAESPVSQVGSASRPR